MPHDVAFCRVCGFPNPVGYLSSEAALGEWKMVGVAFENVGGSGEAVNALDYLKTTATAVPFAEAMTSAASVQIWNGKNYDAYYYVTDALDYDAYVTELDSNDRYNELLEIIDSSLDDEEIEAAVIEADMIDAEIRAKHVSENWCDGLAQIANLAATATGAAFWYYDPGHAASLNFAGQVSNLASIDTDAESGWTMIANPYPTDLKITDIDWNNTIVPVPVANAETLAAQLQVWNGKNYDSYSYVTDALDYDAYVTELDSNDRYNELLEIIDSSLDDEEIEAAVIEADMIDAEIRAKHVSENWCDGLGQIYVGSLAKAGQGFWLKLPAGVDPVTGTFTHP